MDATLLASQIEIAKARVAAFQHKEMDGDAADLLEELQGALEELRVAEELLLQQNQELELSAENIESERRRYEDLFEFAPDAYFVTDARGVIQEANRATE